MNRAFYIIGIVFSVFSLFVAAYYVGTTHGLRLFEEFNPLMMNSDGIRINLTALRIKSTIDGALWTLFFLLAFIAMDILGLIKVKTLTAKVMTIIGLSISGIFLIWDLVVLASPAALSYDEAGMAFMLYSVIMLPFSIVGLVQSVRYYRMKLNGAIDKRAVFDTDLLDS